MRIGFVTCVRLGLECLEEIDSLGGEVDLLVTLHDDLAVKKSGRIYLDDYAERTKSPLVKVRHINDPDSLAALHRAELDWLLVIGWSQIICDEALNSSKHGVLGMHPTLLPQGRGRAPIPWAILKGLRETGVSLFRLGANADNGPIGGQIRIPLAPRETASSLYDKICQGHRQLMSKVFRQLQSGSLRFEPQDESRATYWPQRKPEDGSLSPDMTVAEADRLIRAVTRPYPGAFMVTADETLIIWSGRPASTGARAPSNCIALEFADGIYWAEETDVMK